MPAQVHIDRMPPGITQRQRDAFPISAGLPGTVEEDYCRVKAAADIIGFQPDTSETFEFTNIAHNAQLPI